MKKKIDHWKVSTKEVMLFTGILVAIVILLTLWIEPLETSTHAILPKLPLPDFEYPTTEKVLLQIMESFYQSVR